MKVKKWHELSRQVELETRIFTVEKARMQSADGVRQRDYQVVKAPDWVNVIAFTDEEQVLLIRQFRHGIREITVEIPGGTVDPGESALLAAKRELLEETGYGADRWQPCGKVSPNPAFLTNWTHTFIARGARKWGPPKPDDDEQIDVELVDLQEVKRLLNNGTIHHALVVGAFLQYFLRSGW